MIVDCVERRIQPDLDSTMRKLRLIGLALLAASLAAAAPAGRSGTEQAERTIRHLEDRVGVLEAERDRTAVQQQRDLAAQESMADSAGSMVLPAWLQAVVGLLGTVGLIVSLIVSAFALRQTRAALRDQRESSSRQLRAYLGTEGVLVSGLGAGERPRADLTVRNWGQTPAYNIRETMNIHLVRQGTADEFPDEHLDEGITINPGAASGSFKVAAVELTKEQAEEIERGEQGDHPTLVVYVKGSLEYDDAFGERRMLRYASAHWGPNGRSVNLLTGGNYST